MDRRLRYGLIAAASAVALVIALPFVLPANAYKAEIEDNVARATGRGFTIAGPVSFTLFPMVGVRAGKVALANAEGGRASAMATAQDVRVGVRLAPLLAGRIEVSEIVLERPVINLEVDRQGRANWTFAKTRQPANKRQASGPPANAHFSGLRIVHGRVNYFDARAGSAHTLDDLDATIAVTELDRQVPLGGSFALAGQRVGFSARITTPQSLLRDRATAFDLSLTCELLQASFRGTLSPEGSAFGHAKIDTSSVRRVGTWLGARLPQGGGLGSLSLESQVKTNRRVASLSAMKLKLDGMAIAGNLALNMSGDVPTIKGTLRIDRFDLNPYTRMPANRGRPQAHDDKRWSEDPVALDVLKKVNAELTLDVGSLAVRKLKLAKTRIEVSLKGGRLSARLDPMALYGGAGRAQLDVDTRGSTPAFRNALEFDNVALQPFFADTIGVRQIEGIGTIRLDLVSQGASAGAIMRGLNGTGSIAFHNGRLRGVDLGAVARTIEFVLGAAVGRGAFTDYSGMSGSFTLAHGVLANKDFLLTGPLLRMTGSGAVDIGNRAIDFKLVPKATASVGKQNLVTLGIPFRIKGPWTHVRYTPDVAGIVSGVIENLQTGKAPFKGLFGGSSAARPNDSKKKQKSAGDALKNALGLH